MRAWATKAPEVATPEFTAELAAWLSEPRTNTEIREHVKQYDGVPQDPNNPVLLARTLVPLVQLPPAGYYDDTRRATRFVRDPRPLPDPIDAAAQVIRRYLAAFGPAQRRDVAAWGGVAQVDFAEAWERVDTVSYRDEQGRELLDLPGLPLPPAATELPPRLLGHWDQAMLAHADRERIMPPEVAKLQLTLSGTPTITVDGRVAASWDLQREDDRVQVSDRAARRDRPPGPRRDPRGGAAHGAHLRARRAQLRRRRSSARPRRRRRRAARARARAARGRRRRRA